MAQEVTDVRPKRSAAIPAATQPTAPAPMTRKETNSASACRASPRAVKLLRTRPAQDHSLTLGEIESEELGRGAGGGAEANGDLVGGGEAVAGCEGVAVDVERAAQDLHPQVPTVRKLH